MMRYVILTLGVLGLLSLGTASRADDWRHHGPGWGRSGPPVLIPWADKHGLKRLRKLEKQRAKRLREYYEDREEALEEWREEQEEALEEWRERQEEAAEEWRERREDYLEDLEDGDLIFPHGPAPRGGYFPRGGHLAPVPHRRYAPAPFGGYPAPLYGWPR